MSHESDNVRTQEADCRELCEGRGWEVAGVWVDDGVSAYRGRRVRRGYREMMAAIEAGGIGAVVAYNVDRLQRSNRDFAEFVDICTARRVVVATPSGDVDTTTADGRHYLHGLGAAAEHQSARQSERLRRKHREIAANGGWSGGGKRAYGFEADGVTVREAEAAVVRELARRALAGESINGLTQDLNARGIPAAGGGRWRRHVVKALLRSARISGQREYQKALTAAQWPAIITSAETERLRALLVNGVSRRARSHLLSGVLHCGACGTSMGSAVSHGYPRYLCRRDEGGCGKVGIAAVPLERDIAEALFRFVDNADLASLITRSGEVETEAQAVAEELAKLEHEAQETADLAAAGRIRPQDFARYSVGVEDRQRTLRVRLANVTTKGALDAYAGRPGVLRAAWGTLTLDQRRAALAAAFGRLTVAPVAGRTGGAGAYSFARVTIG
jgi:DNA invertase Pin-like site-specific DNA recombinase